jgi:hypothetical protein
MNELDDLLIELGALLPDDPLPSADEPNLPSMSPLERPTDAQSQESSRLNSPTNTVQPADSSEVPRVDLVLTHSIKSIESRPDNTPVEHVEASKCDGGPLASSEPGPPKEIVNETETIIDNGPDLQACQPPDSPHSPLPGDGGLQVDTKDASFSEPIKDMASDSQTPKPVKLTDRPQPKVKVGRPRMKILGALELIRQFRQPESVPVAVTATQLWMNVPTFNHQLQDSKSIGDAIGQKGLRLIRHPHNRGFVSSKENLNVLSEFLIAQGLETEMLAAARFSSIGEFQSWIQGRPFAQELLDIPLAANQSSSTKISKTEKLRKKPHSKIPNALETTKGAEGHDAKEPETVCHPEPASEGNLREAPHVPEEVRQKDQGTRLVSGGDSVPEMDNPS